MQRWRHVTQAYGAASITREKGRCAASSGGASVVGLIAMFLGVLLLPSDISLQELK